MQLSGARLMVLMFGWPLAVLSLVPIAALGAWRAGIARPQACTIWPGTASPYQTLALGHQAGHAALAAALSFVFILGRGFLSPRWPRCLQSRNGWPPGRMRAT